MEEQEVKGMYKETYAYVDGQIARVAFSYPRTLKEVEGHLPNPKWYEERFGLKRSISQVDDTFLKALLDLSGMKPSVALVHLEIRDMAVQDMVDREVAERREKVYDLKPKPPGSIGEKKHKRRGGRSWGI